MAQIDPDPKKLAAIDFDEILRVEAEIVVRLSEFSADDYPDPRSGQLVLNAYKELRQQLFAMIKIDDARRDRKEVEEMRALVKELEAHAESMRAGGDIMMGPAPEWEQ